ncbi:WD40-repeat-containing domain protein [Cladochytrium replicatum]|nr:WD40-repeat-containing domain protein [Cladochytrium replicatum]
MEELPAVQVRVLSGHSGPVYAATYSADSQYVLTAGADKSVKLWNPVRGVCVKSYSVHAREVLDVKVAPDNSRFVTCGADKNVFLIDVGTGKTIRRCTGHLARVNGVDFNQDASVIASASYDATVRLWDLKAQTRFPIQVLSDAKDDVTGVQVVGNEILTSSVDGCIRVYDMRFGQLTSDQIGFPVTSASFSRDRNCILVSTLDSTIRLFDKSNGELLGEYKGHKNSEYKIRNCLSNSDSHVVGGSEDGRILIWDLVDSKVVKTLQGHTRALTSLTYHRTEGMLVTTSIDGTVRLWGKPEHLSEFSSS